MKATSIEVYKAVMLTLIAILLFRLVSHSSHVIIDSGEIEISNTVEVKTDEPLDVHAHEPLDVNIADQASPIEVQIEK